jgi:hypothetical protein
MTSAFGTFTIVRNGTAAATELPFEVHADALP